MAIATEESIAAAHGLTKNQVRYINLPNIRYEEIMESVNEEPCDECGRKTRECGQLMAKDAKDEEGRKVVLMLCARCITKKGKKVKK